MALKDEIEQWRELWKDGSVGTKAIIVFSLFFTTSSITSLADYVFGWKGFILDGVEFYRTCITAPFSKLGELIGLRWSRPEVDTMIVFALMALGQMRANFTFTSRIGKQAWIVSHSIMFIGLSITLGMIPQDRESTKDYVFLAHLLTVIFLVGYLFAGVMAYRHMPPPRRLKLRLLYFGPGVFACAVVLLLGAVNVGISMSV